MQMSTSEVSGVESGKVLRFGGERKEQVLLTVRRTVPCSWSSSSLPGAAVTQRLRSEKGT